MSNQSEQNTATPSPTPSPSPTPAPHFVPLDELKRRASTPPPPLIKAIEPFGWAELNRANEILKFFDSAIAVFLTRANVDAKLIGAIKTQFAIKLSETVIRKFQVTSTPMSLETAINILDEQLPKLAKSGVDVTDVLQMLTKLRELAKNVGGGRSGEKA